MKKNLSKIELKKNNPVALNPDELNQLKGGSDVYNTNSTAGCMCWYPNSSVTYNQNSEFSCKCTCI